MFEHRINGSELARKSGVDQSRISQFANGKAAITSRSLDKIFDALPTEAKRYLFSLITETSAT
jgi:transcriptional regulator with XRE-family HTH domain